MLRGDFHMHTRYSFDCMTEPQALVDRCREVGLNCIAVTEHNNLEGAQVVKAIAPFLVIQGEEIKSTEGEITGLFLEEEIPPGLTPLETVRRIKDQGALVSIPHPFTGQGRSSLNQATAQDILPHVDIIEGFNARTMRQRDNARGQAFAKAHGLVATAVSDAHTTRELGRAYTELPEFDGTPQGFKEALAEARLVGRPSGLLVHLYSTINKLRHKFISVP